MILSDYKNYDELPLFLNAELIAKETGCQLTPINPLAYDWSREMIRIAKALADGEVD